MRQLLLNKSNLVVKELVQPLLNDHSLLVAVHYTYIGASTDVSKINGNDSFFTNIPHKIKRALESVASKVESGAAYDAQMVNIATNGYSSSGHVVSIGKKVKNFAPGDFIACINLGYSTHADLIHIPEYCAVKISQESNLKAASLVGLAAYALQALRRARLQIGEYVCVLGLDVVGLLMVQLAKRTGCSVIAIDTQQSRLDIARVLGADTVLNIFHDDIPKEIRLTTEHHGVDVSFVVTTMDHVMNYALEASCRQGRVVILGGATASIPFHDHAYAKDIDILIASGLHLGHQAEVDDSEVRWTENKNMDACLAMIEQGALNVGPLIEEEISVKQLGQAYQRIQKNLAVGVVLAYTQMPFSNSLITSCHVDAVTKLTEQTTPRFVPAISDVIKIGVIGAYTKTVLPFLSRVKNITVKLAVDYDIRRSSFARQYPDVKMVANDEEFFSSGLIDAVVIASAHTLHAEHALQALAHGKAVFLEKPMTTDFGQLQRLCAFLRKNKQVPLCVDYHCSFSAFAQKIKSVVQERKTPLMVHYRVNRELQRSDRIKSSMKIGYILGDSCQIIDLFCYLTGARPVSVSVEAMHSSRDDIFPTDNISAHIGFSDGSVCSLLYTVLGHSGLGSERMEIFYDEKAILMEDYMELYGFGFPTWFNETVTVPDNGHEKLLTQFFASLQREPYVPLIDPERLHMVADVTLLIDQLACEGGGKKAL